MGSSCAALASFGITHIKELPLPEELGGRIICPPIHLTVSPEDNEYIAAAVWDAAENIAAEA